MKVLYITCGSGADPTVGGSLIRTMETARWVRERAKISFLTTSGGREALRGIFRVNCIFALRTPLLKSMRSGEYAYKQLFSYLSIFLQSLWKVPTMPDVDLIYTDSDGLWDVLPALIYKFFHPRSRWVAMNHHLIIFRRENLTSLCFSAANIVLQKLGYFFIRHLADAAFVLDTDAGDEIRTVLRRGNRGLPIWSVKDGVEIESIRAVPAPSIRYQACYFGGFRLGKGMDEIVPMWQKVCRRLPEAKLILIGGMLDKFRNDLNSQIAHGNLENNIFITGYVNEKEEAIRMVKESKVFISLSHEEGWGIAIMECLAAGLPGILWDLPIFRRIIKKGVIKVTRFNLDDFADAVISLLEDRTRYDQLQKEAEASVRSYDWKVVAEEDYRFFQEIIDL